MANTILTNLDLFLPKGIVAHENKSMKAIALKYRFDSVKDLLEAIHEGIFTNKIIGIMNLSTSTFMSAYKDYGSLFMNNISYSFEINLNKSQYTFIFLEGSDRVRIETLSPEDSLWPRFYYDYLVNDNFDLLTDIMHKIEDVFCSPLSMELWDAYNGIMENAKYYAK